MTGGSGGPGAAPASGSPSGTVSTDEIDGYAHGAGFEKIGQKDLGHNILLKFKKSGFAAS